jgi:cysteine desulfurase / selenocysteine lyase
MPTSGTVDVDRARAETPGCAEVAHLNNAGTSLPPQPVLDAHLTWLQEEAVTGGYEYAATHDDQRQQVYAEVAALVGARPDEIALMENATAAWHQAFWSLPLAAGDRILTCEAEYATSYISYLQAVQRKGVRVEVVPSDGDGQIDLADLARRLDPADQQRNGRVGLVGATHAPTNGGLVNPAERIGELTRSAGVPFLLDACQSVGQLPVDVEAIGCDLLAATGRKFLRAPRGTGFLYVRTGLIETMEPAFLDLLGAEWTSADTYEIRPDARRFENWEASPAGLVGLGAAAAYARSWGLDAIAARVGALADGLRERLAALDGVQVRDIGVQRSGIVTFTKDDVDPEAIKAALNAEGINVWTTYPPSSLLDATARHLPPMVRASVHYYNTDDELDRTSEVVARILPQ